MSRIPYVALSFPEFSGRQRPRADDIVEVVSKEIAAGHLHPGLRLPPVRVLARQLEIAKGTVQSAYDELAARGFIEARGRTGMFILGKSDARPRAAFGATPPPAKLRSIGIPPQDPADATLLNLSQVFIDPALLPRERLSDCIRSVLHAPGLRPLYEAQGHRGLRQAIAQRLQARGMDVEADEVIITTGSQQALDMVVRCLADRRVAMESPVYHYAMRVVSSLDGDICSLKLDPFRGIDMQGWRQQLAKSSVSLLYAISSYQNPTGYCYSSAELQALLELAQEFGFALLEDDWGSEMLSDSEYRPTLRGLGGSNILYVNSFTKKLWPSLRIGYLVGPRAQIPELVAAKRCSTLGTTWLAEAAVHEFLDRGYYDAHLSRLHGQLDERYADCLQNLAAHMPAGVRWTRPGGGPTLWIDLPRSIDLPRLKRQMRAQGMTIEVPDDHYDGAPHLHGFRLGFAALPSEDLRRGIIAVAESIAEQGPR